MSQSSTLDIGWDVPQRLDCRRIRRGRAPALRSPTSGRIGTRQCDIDQLVRTRTPKPHTWFWSMKRALWRLARSYLTTKGHHGWVVAPSLIPQKAGTA